MAAKSVPMACQPREVANSIYAKYRICHNDFMAILEAEFQEYDRTIRPEDALLQAARSAHIDVRKRLNADEKLSQHLVSDFLQGSYARYTMNDPEDKADVDIIVVTRLHEKQWTPDGVLTLFATWLAGQYGQQRVSKNGRSVNLELDNVEVDLVPTSAPSEAVMLDIRSYAAETVAKAITPGPEDDLLNPNEVFGPSITTIGNGDWALAPLRIPDLHAKAWQDTHPLAALEYTRQKNRECDKMFLRVVRAIKWWRKRVSGGPEHPKSYPIEHMVGDACLSGTFKSVAEGITLTLEAMQRRYYNEYLTRKKPTLKPRGLEHLQEANVLALLQDADFCAFYEQLEVAAANARLALDETNPHKSGKAWQRVLGDEFPVPPPSKTGPTGGGFTPRTDPAREPAGGRFG
jgi:Second Messenger Oligonucleotide or Dinucleotide Synthetase domain